MHKYQISFPEIKAMAEASEKEFDEEITGIAEKIYAQNPEIILITGPSSSGKSTCAKRMMEELADLGRPSIYFSLDNFFYDIKERDGKGDDMESVELLDTDMLYYCTEQLLSGEPTHVPSFDFASTRRYFDGKQHIMKKNGILIYEGIHALDPKVLKVFEKRKYVSLYISVEQSIEFDDGEIWEPNEIRMLRRVIRDYNHRGSSPDDTLDIWKGVLKSENERICIHKDEADYVLDSYFAYEPYMMKKQYAKILPLIKDDGEYAELKAKYLECVKKLVAASTSLVPADSILCEFIS